MLVDRYFTINPENLSSLHDEEVVFDAVITGADGTEVFRQDNVSAPESWSQTAVNIVASKYFAGKLGHGEREGSVYDMVQRVAFTIADAGLENGYFFSEEDKLTFQDELTYILLTQRASFNSPVWFNVGVHEKPQCSACFILSVNDSMDSILEWIKVEGKIFKGGSGSGVNLSNLRGSMEHLSGGGVASGPVSFMRGADASAGAIKSGGTTRRAAKMVILNADHPDIEEFIWCKAKEEKKAWALGEAGYDMGLNGEAWTSIQFQNANNSVRASDWFMEKATGAEADNGWVGSKYKAVPRKDDSIAQTLSELNASGVLDQICEAAWICGDPGMQFDDTINEMHTCPNSGRINGSNPCCFVGETLVDTSEGKIQIGELAQAKTLPYVFAYDSSTNLPVLRSIDRVWKAGETRRLVEVITDRGIVVHCTPEHRFLLRNGEYVEAEFLSPGDRLRKIGRWINERRSNRHYINHRETERASNGTVIQSRFMWEQVHGLIPRDMDVHHINGDSTDDRLSNFELIKYTEHKSSHSAGLNNPNSVLVSESRLLDTWEAIERTGEVTVWRWNKYIRDNCLQGIVPQAGSPTHGGRIQGRTWKEFTEYMQNLKLLANDTVKSVRVINLVEAVSVYDMEVEGIHNFAVASEDAVHSIVVHNSEYMHIDNSACNLASINLMKFRDESGKFLVEGFEQTVKVLITAMDILVTISGYPTKKIENNAKSHRQLGLGYANLGALLMANGVPYDSVAGREYAAAITSLMCGQAYVHSTTLARQVGSFHAFHKNALEMIAVLEMHMESNKALHVHQDSDVIIQHAHGHWGEAITSASEGWMRNSQATVLAPTGTIGFMMDCDTTGVEPAISLISYKTIVGGGHMKLVNQTVELALETLGYTKDDREGILDYIADTGTIEGAPGIRELQLPVFDCAFAAGERTISPEGHVKMMGAVQPFISGAISKTVNLPETATPQDIREMFILAWECGVKAIAVYRDGSKRTQPLSAKLVNSGVIEEEQERALTASETLPAAEPIRKRLPKTRQSVTHHFEVAGHDGYVNVGLYENGTPGEVFVTMAKQGSTLQGLMDSFAISMSIGLQHGVPLEVFINKFCHTRFEPSGWTGYSKIPHAKSLIDYIARWLAEQFLPLEKQIAIGLNLPKALDDSEEVEVDDFSDAFVETGPQFVSVWAGSPAMMQDAPPCTTCGSTMIRAGSCYTCPSCGGTSGCS